MNPRCPYLLGILLGLASALGSAVIAIMLAGAKQVPTNWVLLLQSSVALLVSCAAPAAGRVGLLVQPRPAGRPAGLRTARYGKHLLRAVAGLAIYAFYYEALKQVPKVDCSLLLNTAPLFVPLLGMLTFGDRVPGRVWAGVVLGFVGVTVVLAPAASFRALERGHLFALLGGLSFAWSMVLVRDLNRTEPVTTTVFYYHVHSVVCLLVVAALLQQPISGPDVALCLAVGAIFCAKLYAITLAVKWASAATATMLNFTAIPLLALYGVLVEGKDLHATVVLGSMLVVLGSVSVIVAGRRDALGPKDAKGGNCPPEGVTPTAHAGERAATAVEA
jgi:drug/metabolite transporter (DMT)-like permease